MEDEIELCVGSTVVPNCQMMSWRSGVELIFAEIDFRQRSFSRAHAAVRDRLTRRRRYDSQALYLISSAEAVRARLRIQGYTAAHCRTIWTEARNELAARGRRMEEREEASSIGLTADELERIEYDSWLDTVREQHASGPMEGGRRRKQPWPAANLLGIVTDPIVSMLLLLEALGGPVWLNCAPLYDYELDTSLTPHALLRRDEERERRWSGGKIIVLTEGRSDTRVVTAALQAFYPELVDAYQFLDFEEFRIEGGASPLARMVKILSGARLSNRMIALFDNDAAGIEALRNIATLRLPHTVRLLALPDIASARNYPTLGPGGQARMDVNGAAASIELYLGKDSLIGIDGALRPIRWTEWRQQIGRYQGAVLDKDDVVKTFLLELDAERQPSILRRRFPDMDRLLRSVFTAFEDLSPPSI